MLKRAILFLAVAMLMASCEKVKDKCIAPNAGVNLIGKWSASWNSSSKNICQIEFRQDGTYAEDKDLLLGDYYSPKATWKMDQNSLIVSATYSIPSTTTYIFSVLENECNEIVLDLQGQEKIKLSRK
jgi:hypothetical protein